MSRSKSALAALNSSLTFCWVASGVFWVTFWRCASAAAGLMASSAAWRFSAGVSSWLVAVVCCENAFAWATMETTLMAPEITEVTMPNPSEIAAAVRMSSACCLIEFWTCWFSVRRISRDVSRSFCATSTMRAISANRSKRIFDVFVEFVVGSVEDVDSWASEACSRPIAACSSLPTVPSALNAPTAASESARATILSAMD